MNTAYDIDLDQEKREAEEWLIHYTYYRDELEQQRNDIVNSNPSIENMPIKHKTMHGNQTCSKAVKLINHSNRNERTMRWIKAVEATRAHFAKTNSNHGVFITERYDMGMQPGQIAADLGISRAMVFNLRNEVLSYLTGVHSVYGNNHSLDLT